MDWLITKIRLWLGIEAEMMVLKARIDALDSARATENAIFFKRIEENCRFAEQLSKQISDLREVVTAKAPPKPVVRARSWTEARRMMNDEVLQDG